MFSLPLLKPSKLLFHSICECLEKDLTHLIWLSFIKGVATLLLGSRPRQGLARVKAKREARESHLMLLGV